MARQLDAAAATLLVALSLGGCAQNQWSQSSLSDRECMARVMYFESNRSSEDGMLAVGTVVMNRLQDHKYPKTVCGVIGQRSQFADGALTKSVNGASWTRALRVADAVLAGERHATVGSARFFHTTGMTFPYRNMAYVVVAGGNAFYDKKTPGTFERYIPTATTLVAENAARRQPERTRLAEADDDAPPPRRREPVRLASAFTEEFDLPPSRSSRPANAERSRRADADENAPRRTRPAVRLASAADDEVDTPPARARAPTTERSRIVELDDDEPSPPIRPSRPAQAARQERTPLPDRPRSAEARPTPNRDARSTQRNDEPLVLATAARRERAPPSIGELIDLDLERPKRR